MKILRCIHSLNPVIGGPLEVGQTIVPCPRPSRPRGGSGFARCANRSVAAGIPGDGPRARAGPRELRLFGTSCSVAQERHAQYDAVVVHGIWQYNSLGTWRALHKAVTPYFVFPHGMLDPWFNRTYPLKHLKKMLYWPWAEYRVLRDAKAVLLPRKKSGAWHANPSRRIGATR